MSKKRAALSRKLAISLLTTGAIGVILTTPPAAYAATLGSLEGTVTSDENGQPISGAEVALLAPDGSVQQRAKTDAKGNFFFGGLPPGSYTVRASVVTFKILTQPVTVTQDQTASISLSLIKTIVTGQSTVRVPAIPGQRLTQTATAQVVTAQGEQQRKSQAYDLYQYPGILIGQPGFTEDPTTGLVSIRGADINAVGYQLDGVDITDPRSNYFGTNLVTTGLKSANVYTAGADASYGGHTGGFVNVITNNGRDIRGGVTEYTGPGSSNWSYSGTNTQYGNVIPGTKLDYYVSTIVFKNGFPNGVFGLKEVHSYDGLFKVNYYADNNNTFTVEHTNGFEGYKLFNDLSTARFDEKTRTFNNTSQYDGLENQTYMLDTANFKHNFTNKAYASLRYFRLRNGYEENDGVDYVTQDDTKQGLNLDYVNQLARNDQLKAGYYYEPSGLTFDEIFDPDTIEPNAYFERIHTYQNSGYLTNQVKVADNKLVLDTGLRAATMKYDLVTRTLADGSKVNPSYSTTYIDPRVGAAYAVSKSTVIRSNYGITSQFPDAGRAQYFIGPGAGGTQDQIGSAGTVSTYSDLNAQARYGTGNHLKAEHSENVDLGIEEGLGQQGGLLDGIYDVQLNTYKRHETNQILYERTTYVPLSGPRVFTNNGRADATGVEFVLTKRVRRPSDWNGFLSYTNQVEKNTGSLLTSYESLFYNAFAGTSLGNSLSEAQFAAANKQEYQADFAQRHTVYVNANKRFSRLLESSLNLDAGSGYPFVAGVGGTLAGLEGIDSQHGFNPKGGGSFAEVPILLPGGQKIQPLSTNVGTSSWHYKISLNTNFYLTDRTNLFFNVDNIFDRQTTLIFAPTDSRGNEFYEQPSAAYPQGRVIYGPNITNTPVQVTFGFRSRF